MKPLVIIGSGGHAGVVIDAVRRGTAYKIVGLLDDYIPEGTEKHGCKILGKIESFGKWSHYEFFVAVGDAVGRRAILRTFEASILYHAAIVHPSAHVAGYVCPGAYVGAGASVGPNSTVWEFSILNTNSTLEHDSEIGSFSHMAPNSTTGGHVSIGRHTMIGIGACIRDHITIGDKCTIGMGSVVTKSVPSETKGWGNPFRAR